MGDWAGVCDILNSSNELQKLCTKLSTERESERDGQRERERLRSDDSAKCFENFCKVCVSLRYAHWYKMCMLV